MIKLKPYIPYTCLSLLLLFLATILLDNNADLLLYLLCLLTGALSFAVGISNNMEIKKLGFGITRKKIFNSYVYNMIIMLALTLGLIIFEFIFVLLIQKSLLDISYRLLIMTYLASLTLSLVALLIVNLYANKKIIITSLIICLLFFISFILINNLLVINVCLVFLIIALYFINRYIIYHTDFKIN